MVEISVALPLFRAKYIAWLALESLCRQKGVTFEWELLISEEQNNELFGKKEIFEYKKRLEGIKCVSIKYKPLKKKIPLSTKWNLLFNMSDEHSRAIIIQAADVFSYPNRLEYTWKAFKENKNLDWYRENKGIFYDISSGEMALWNYEKQSKRSSSSPCGMWFAINRNKSIGIKDSKLNKRVDGWLWKSISPQKIP